jgi:FKBP-type peptidyl-prolyl cis-trans isomerase SlyD
MSPSKERVAADSVVGIAYTLRLEGEQVIDEASSDDALEYLHGHSNIIPGLESALEGKHVGDVLAVEIPPSEAYGPRDEEDIALVPNDALPEDLELEVGLVLTLEGEGLDGPVDAYVAEIREDGVIMDLNHPLAGETLRFDVTVVSVRQATQEELDHGHVHQAGHDH